MMKTEIPKFRDESLDIKDAIYGALGIPQI